MDKIKLSQAIDDYFALQEEIYEAFGYEENYAVIPLDDQSSMHWMIDGPEDASSSMCAWSEEPFTKESIKEGSTIYSGPIYTQRFLKKWVYRSKGHVLVCVDTRTDGNKFLMIFDEALECKDETLRKLHSERWGSGRSWRV